MTGRRLIRNNDHAAAPVVRVTVLECAPNRNHYPLLTQHGIVDYDLHIVMVF